MKKRNKTQSDDRINKTQIPWIQKGYQIFALESPSGMKVERLAKAVGKNKSSFYHFFADLEVFTDFLLKYHLAQSEIKVNEISLPSIIPIWSDIIGLRDNSYLAGLVLQLSLENFFLQIIDEILNPNWLNQYFENIKDLVRQFKKTGAVLLLDSSV